MTVKPIVRTPKPRTIPKLIWSEDYWTLRADQARVYSPRQQHAECQRIMREIAKSYEHLAELTYEYCEAAKAGARNRASK